MFLQCTGEFRSLVIWWHNQFQCNLEQKHLRLEGLEPPTFGSGIRRAANCAIASNYFLVRDSNPGRQGENLVSWPTRLTRSYLYVTNCQIYIYFTGACNIFKRVPQLFSQTPYKNKIRAPRIELGTYCVLSSRHNQLDQARTSNI